MSHGLATAAWGWDAKCWAHTQLEAQDHNKRVLTGGSSRLDVIMPKNISQLGVGPEAALPAHGFGLIAAVSQGLLHATMAFWHVSAQVLAFVPLPLSFTSCFTAFLTPQPPPSDNSTAIPRRVSLLPEREISSFWNIVLNELITSWSMFAECP